jgi:hexosaminidase
VLPVSLAGRTVSIWENDQLQIDPKTLPAGTVANVYQNLATADVTIANYSMPTVVSLAGENWYLDSQPDGAYNWNSWQARYSVEPTSNVTSQPELLPLLLGGESCMWGEGINKRNFDNYVWHGAAAIGERLWSTANTTDIDDMQLRLSEHMCRSYAMKGYNPGPVVAGFCAADL